MEGRPNVSIGDVRKVAIPVLRHRIATNFQAQAEGLDIDEIITKLIATVPEPNIPKYER
jgi:MoxR-like ATPase